MSDKTKKINNPDANLTKDSVGWQGMKTHVSDKESTYSFGNLTIIC